MLPSGAVKGGTAMKLRVGEGGSRFTPDFDVSSSANVELDEYLDDLAVCLAAGWSGLTGTLEELKAAQPEGVPEDYVMQPFLIRLVYRGRHWLTVKFELGHDEIGSTSQKERRIAGDLIQLFDELGLQTPDPVPVLALDHQVAQKLHACTSRNARGGNDRAHDLVDLQILEQEETINMRALGVTANRLFVARRGHVWPPTVVEFESWNTIYREAADGLDVIDNVADAVVWANDFIARTMP
jgi:hypothetical protein